MRAWRVLGVHSICVARPTIAWIRRFSSKSQSINLPESVGAGETRHDTRPPVSPDRIPGRGGAGAADAGPGCDPHPIADHTSHHTHTGSVNPLHPISRLYCFFSFIALRGSRRLRVHVLPQRERRLEDHSKLAVATTALLHLKWRPLVRSRHTRFDRGLCNGKACVSPHGPRCHMSFSATSSP